MRYAVYEEPEFPRLNLSLVEAFHTILTYCHYEPVWTQSQTSLSLQFRYLEGAFKGQIVGTQFPGDKPETVQTALDGDGWMVARGDVMRQVLTLGLRGWRGVKMTEFWRKEVVPSPEMMAKYKGTSTRDWL